MRVVFELRDHEGAMDANGHLVACVDDTDREPLGDPTIAYPRWRPHLVEFQSALYPFLVADPACPHLAPWSPA